MKQSKWSITILSLLLTISHGNASINRFKRSFVEEDQVLILDSKTETHESIENEDQFLFEKITKKWILSPLSSSQFPYSALIELNGSDDQTISLGGVVQFAPRSLPMMVSALNKVSYTSIDKKSDQIFLSDDKTTILKDPQNASFVILTNINQIKQAYRSKKALAGDISYWNECSGPVTGNYFLSDEKQLRCHQSRMISKSFQSFLQTQLPRCVQSSISRLGMRGIVQSIHLTHTGLTGDERHRNAGGSLHNIERALDIKFLTARLTNKKMLQFNYGNGVKNPRTIDRKFFQVLRQCWQDAHIKRDPNCYMNKKPNGHVASIGWEDQKHQKHLHISYPICGKNKQGFFLL